MSRASRANPELAAERLAPLLDEPAVKALARLAPPDEVLLVGGALRDQLLGRPVRDFDAVLPEAGEEAAEELAGRLGVRVIRLGGDRFAAYRLETGEFRIDLWDRGAMSLEEDLRRRDFTINSMALRLHDRRLLDPCGGLADLERRLLRATSETSFDDDPLRVLRLVRFAAALRGFETDPPTLELARTAAAGLDRVAPERVREELHATFAGPGVAHALALLVDLDLYPSLWSGEPGAADTEALEARLERLELHAVLLETALGPGAVDRFVASQAVLFAALPAPTERLERSRRRRLLSNRDARAVGRLLEHRALPAGEPGRRWLLHRLGELWPTGAAYLASDLADERRGDLEALAELARTDARAIFAPDPLLDGHEIAELLGLEPGPRLGELAGALRRAQIEGRVTTRRAAVEWLERTGGAR